VSTSTTATTTLLRRTIQSSPTARALLRTPVLRRAIGAGRAARLLRPTGHFLARELKAEAMGRYAIRGTGQIVHLRHGSRDVEIFNEIFSPGRMSYEPPAQISAALSALGPLRIGDLGGNIGLFGVYALRRWDIQTLHSFEPDPANVALLRATLAANDTGQRWELEPTAISTQAGTASFEAGMHSESRLAVVSLETDRARQSTFAADSESDHAKHDRATVDKAVYGRGGTSAARTIEVTVVDLFLQPPFDLLKIDIEGAEWPILADRRLASYPARAIVLEWHRRMCPAFDPQLHARQLLATAGYEVLGDEPSGTPANGLMWGLRQD
jgi:FkbM family methyltransferase